MELVRFGSKADMCSAQADVRFVPIADIQLAVERLYQISDEHSSAWQSDDDFGELAGLCIDVD